MNSLPNIDSLRLAAASLDLHAKAPNLIDAERQWKDFLTYLDRFANHMLDLKTPGLQKYVSEMGKLRNSDPLLVYLRHARNSNEHTVREIVGVLKGAIGGSGTSITGGPGGGTIFSGSVVGGQDGTNLRAVNIIVQFGPDRLELVSVYDRSGKHYPVPASHLGNPLTSMVPLEVGKIGLACYQKLFPEFA